MRVILFAFAALLTASGAVCAADLAGSWKGTWTKDGDALPMTVSFEKAATGYAGSFDSDALQVASIPFADVSDASGKIHWLLKGDETTTAFDGALHGDALAGTFTEGATKGTFVLARAALPAHSISSRDVKFANGGVTLAGTLLLPASTGRHPAILFLHGSGPEGRWANRWLAQKFAESGIAALIFDKRGVGASTGDWKTAGFDVLAGDAVAGIRFLRTQEEVDPARIGIYGHSQGGTIAPLVAAKDGHLAFVIASAAAGLDPADVERYSVGNSIGISALPPAERRDADTYVQVLIDVAYRDKPRAALDALAAKFKSREWYFAPPPPGNSYWTLSRQFASFNPSVWWKQVKARVLLLYGAHDERIEPTRNAEAIHNALFAGNNARVTLKLYPNADHTFTIVEPPKKGGWPAHEPDYSAYVVNWAVARTGKPR
jgi:dipeptidyl aminopeptidase/acylaminoacyl peptidase